MIRKKLCRVFGITLEPVSSIPETKTVAPVIHVQHEAVATYALNVVSQYKLQIADGGFFQVITTGVSMKGGTSVCSHANHMTGLVKE